MDYFPRYRTSTKKVPIMLSFLFTMVLPYWAQWQNAIIDTITNTQIRKETERQSLGIDSLDFVHLVWKRDQGSNWQIFYATNNPGGQWINPQEVSDSGQACSSPYFAVSAITGNPVIIFEDDQEICVAYQTVSEWQQH